MSSDPRAGFIRSGAGLNPEDVGMEMLGELVKSYGFQYERATGWQWSAGNVQKAFEDEPIWTTIDYLAFGVPMSKWGVAAARVSKGAKAIQATGSLEGATVLGKTGGFAAAEYAAGTKTLRESADLLMRTPTAQTRFGRMFESSLNKSVDFDMIDQHWDKLDEVTKGVYQRGIVRQWAREKRITEQAALRDRDTIVRMLDKLPEEQREKVFMRLDTVPGSEAHSKAMEGMTDVAQNAYEASYPFRNWIHGNNWRIDAISQATHDRHFNQWQPHIVKEFYAARGLAEKEGIQGAAIGSGLSKKRALEQLRHQRVFNVYGEEWADTVRKAGLTPILDPRVTVTEMADHATNIAHHDFFMALARSKVLFKEVDTPGTEGWKKLRGIFPSKSISKYQDDLEWQQLSQHRANLLRRREFKTLDEVHSHSKELREVTNRIHEVENLHGLEGGMRHVKPEILDMVVDPVVADEIAEVVNVLNTKNNPILQFAFNLNSAFKISKTALNPATHGRNMLSGIVFNSLATGKFQVAPTEGAQTMLKALKGNKVAMAEVREAMGRGVLGHTFSDEIMQDLAKTLGGMEDAKNFGVNWLKSFPDFQKLAKKGKLGATNVYGMEDDIWKLNSYLVNRKKFLKNGLEPEMARARAAHETVKFHPMYGDTNEFTQTVRRFVPFTSFTTETIRVWKNAMTYKPHWVMGWAHGSDLASEVVAAGMGVSQEQLEEAQQALPDWTRGKKRLLLPWRDRTGSLQWLDMSYLIPLADMAGEAEKMEGSLFGIPPELNPAALFGITSNPLVSMAVATTLGRDPFTGREIQPETTERLTGVAVPEYAGPFPVRPAVGLVEHVARTLLPPLAPPGFAGMNLAELATGEVDPRTGELREPDIAKTIAANLLGLRTLTPSESGARSQLYLDKQKKQRLRTNAWRRLEWAQANDDPEIMEREAAILIDSYGSRREYLKALKKRSQRVGRGSLTKAEAAEARRRNVAAGGQAYDPFRGRKLLQQGRQLGAGAQGDLERARRFMEGQQ